MPTQTLDPIQTITLVATAASVQFSSISAIYKDLQLVAELISPSSASLFVRVNGDTAANYSRNNLYGNGTTAIGDRGTSETLSYVYPAAIGAAPSTFITHFINYADTTMNKSWITRGSDSTLDVSLVQATWRSTAAINTILFGINSGTFGIGSKFTLFGIKG